MKIWWYKLKNWEYWPVYVVYCPTFFYWVWLMLRFRCFDFYKYSNVGIPNGGFYGDSKYDIYKMLPQKFYPKTILIKQNDQPNFEKIISNNNLFFPLILKPDVGLRGINVQKVNSIEEIENYFFAIKEDFLIQEYIDLKNELGLFYVRFPNQIKGKISGITIKRFLTIEGNNEDTILKLLKKKPRFEMQIKKLADKINLNEVLESNEVRCLVPYGNHNRGTEFLDGKDYISPQLENIFDTILSQVPGFNYGRLDIRYNSFEELEQGVNFSIIELNGAKSEPTHIYDPKHSFFYGQKEIFKHQKMLKKIVKQNLEIKSLSQNSNSK